MGGGVSHVTNCQHSKRPELPFVNVPVCLSIALHFNRKRKSLTAHQRCDPLVLCYHVLLSPTAQGEMAPHRVRKTGRPYSIRWKTAFRTARHCRTLHVTSMAFI